MLTITAPMGKSLEKNNTTEHSVVQYPLKNNAESDIQTQ
jgi:hypothetical protein